MCVCERERERERERGKEERERRREHANMLSGVRTWSLIPFAEDKHAQWQAVCPQPTTAVFPPPPTHPVLGIYGGSLVLEERNASGSVPSAV